MNIRRTHYNVCAASPSALKINTDGARIEDMRIHDLRRTLGSWQARTGASIVVIGKSLGHKSHQATAVYLCIVERYVE